MRIKITKEEYKRLANFLLILIQINRRVKRVAEENPAKSENIPNVVPEGTLQNDSVKSTLLLNPPNKCNFECHSIQPCACCSKTPNHIIE